LALAAAATGAAAPAAGAEPNCETKSNKA